MNRLQTIVAYNENLYNRERAFNALYGFYMDNHDINGLLLLCEKLKNDNIKSIRHFAEEFMNNNRN